jgi:pimeloyl-ACP methyl ester carboxylesterase
MKTDNFLTLPDGRKLSYAEFGKPGGYPVLYCHGIPSSRLEPLLFGDDVLNQFGLRLIAPDRPGMGGSDFQTHRGFSDWPEDVVFLVDALGLDRFSVFGVSGGGGYVAVCAAKIPERLAKVVIASGGWRIDSKAIKEIDYPLSMMWQVTTHAPILLPIVIKMISKMMNQTPKGGFDQVKAPPNKILPAVDHAVMAHPDRISSTQRILGETLKQGTKGPAWDYRLMVREWDFDLAEVQMPLTLFHGGLDGNFPLSLVERVVNGLPRAQLIAYPEEGHISIMVNRFDEIAKVLMPG